MLAKSDTFDARVCKQLMSASVLGALADRSLDTLLPKECTCIVFSQSQGFSSLVDSWERQRGYTVYHVRLFRHCCSCRRNYSFVSQLLLCLIIPFTGPPKSSLVRAAPTHLHPPKFLLCCIASQNRLVSKQLHCCHPSGHALPG